MTPLFEKYPESAIVELLDAFIKVAEKGKPLHQDELGMFILLILHARKGREVLTVARAEKAHGHLLALAQNLGVLDAFIAAYPELNATESLH